MHLYADNVPAINLFTSLITQWRVGMGGAYGLDYNVLYHKMDRMGLTPDQYLELEAHVRVCEEGALQQMAQNSEETQAKSKRK